MADATTTLINGNDHTPERLPPPTTSTLLSYDKPLNREQLALVPTPEGTATHHPYPHIDPVNSLIDKLTYRNISTVKEEYAVSADGNRMFGIIEIANGFTGARYVIGIRNSHDKTFALGLTIGYRVFVCENLAFRGDYTPVLRKHTKNFNLEETMSIGVDNIQKNFPAMAADVQRWRETQITDDQARLLIYDAYVQSGTDLPKALMRPTHEHYFNPQHQEFQDRTLWSLQNAFTSSIKNLDLIPQQKAAATIGEYFNNKTL